MIDFFVSSVVVWLSATLSPVMTKSTFCYFYFLSLWLTPFTCVHLLSFNKNPFPAVCVCTWVLPKPIITKKGVWRVMIPSFLFPLFLRQISGWFDKAKHGRPELPGQGVTRSRWSIDALRNSGSNTQLSLMMIYRVMIPFYNLIVTDNTRQI